MDAAHAKQAAFIVAADQKELLKLVKEFVDEQIIPVATELEHRDEYPQAIVDVTRHQAWPTPAFLAFGGPSRVGRWLNDASTRPLVRALWISARVPAGLAARALRMK